MHMIRLAVELFQCHFEVGADRSDYLFEPLPIGNSEYLAAPLGDEHQVGVEDVNNVPAFSYFGHLDQHLQSCISSSM